MGTQGRLKQCVSLEILSGAAVSNAIPSSCIEDMVAALVYGPATLDALTFTFQVNPDPRATNATAGWIPLCDSTGTPIGPPAAAKAQLYSELPHAGAIRISASGNVAANRLWQITGIETV